MLRQSAVLAAILVLGACATVASPSRSLAGMADMAFPDGRPAGSARLMRETEGLVLYLDAAGLSAGGTHGAHLHSVGKCEGPAFTSAGPHLNPFGKSHGVHSANGRHLGDLPNIMTGASGTGSMKVPLEGDPATVEAQLFDADGTAVVIHAAADDYQTDPSGNSGARIACGVMRRAS